MEKVLISFFEDEWLGYMCLLFFRPSQIINIINKSAKSEFDCSPDTILIFVV